MVKGGHHTKKSEGSSADPLHDFVRRQVTGAQVRKVLDRHINPFTKTRWSGKYYGRKLLDARKRLPVFGYMNSFFEAFNSHQVIIVHGDTGTGKTTQIPQLVAYADLPRTTGQRIGCAQTRRLAATAAAKRVADEMDVDLGQEVGYSVRFDTKTDDSTFLVFMTDGMLLHEATKDKDFKKYSTIILDEVHERTIATDVLMGFLKDALSRRNDLKIVIMSATMDAAQLGRYFGANDPFLLEVLGSAHPVEIEYSPVPVGEDDYNRAAIEKVLEIHRDEPEGDILVFLTGEDEIEDACIQIEELVQEHFDPRVFGPLVCLPLYSNLPPHLQRRVWEDLPQPPPEGRPGRKAVIATNIAETSLTIEGVVYVVDSGYAKPRVVDQDSESGLERHTVQKISKASAHQRKGRAGRTRAGKCFRLYTEEEFKRRPDREPPQMQTVSLGELVLLLAANGFKKPSKFPYMDPPDRKALARAQSLLVHLKAIDKHKNLTALGQQMVQFPVDVQLSKMLITSPNFACSEEIVTITAMLSSPPVWVRPRGKGKGPDRERTKAREIKSSEFDDKSSDHLTLLNVFNAYMSDTSHVDDDTIREEWCKEKYVSFKALREAQSIRTQLVRIMRRLGIPLISSYVPMARNARLSADDAGEWERLRENIRKALVSGCFLQVAHSSALSDLALTSRGNTRGTLNLGSGEHGRRRTNLNSKQMRESFRTIRDNTGAVLHPSSVLPLTEASEWVIFHEFVQTKQPFIRTVTAIEEAWLEEYPMEVYNLETYKDPETKKAIERIQEQIREGRKKAEEQREKERKAKEKREKNKGESGKAQKNAKKEKKQ